MKNAKGNEGLRFDIAIPSLRLIIEYHGGHHYHDTFIFGELKFQEARDSMKRTLCQLNNWTLLEIPYWWDFSFDQLANALHHLNPELVPNTFGDGRGFPLHPTAQQIPAYLTQRRAKSLWITVSDL